MDALKRAIKVRADHNYTIAIINADREYTSTERGIKPILNLLDADAQLLCGASVADKVVGKAAALLMCYAKVKEVHSCVLSKPSLDVFAACGVPAYYDTLVDNIINREGTDICPMESRALNLTDPEDAYRVFSDLFRGE